MSVLSANASLFKTEHKDITIKNRMFAITLPYEAKGLYKTKITKDKICIYDKESTKAGFGGFAFGVKAYKNPADHAVLPGGRKIGELTDKKGVLYDMVLKYPTDVQYDYTKNEVSKSYARLYDLGETVNIEGAGKNKYFKNQGMKGEDLYKEILQKHITAIKEKWDSAKLEQENMSYMYNVIRMSDKNPMDKVGYVFYDANADGIDELLIGEITDGDWKGIIYDMYTMVNRTPQHVISGGSRNRYYICNGTFVCNEYSSGAKESGLRVYILVDNTTQLFEQVRFKYDAYENPEKPWFISYGVNENLWEIVSEEYFNERKATFEKYNRFNFIPLSKF